MNKLILHVGFPKCGSSALQSFLCKTPRLSGAKQNYAYYVVKNGRVLDPAWGRLKAHVQPWGYTASDENMVGVIEAVLRHREKHPDDTVPVLSQERWGAGDIDAEKLETLLGGAKVEVIAYAKPHVTWLQSAWWQWYYWQRPRRSIEEMWDRHKSTLQWSRMLERFDSAPFVASVTARPLCSGDDIVADFLGCLDVPAPDAPRSDVNSAMSKAHIDFYKRFPGLRSRHDSRMDAVLKKFFSDAEPSPWAIDQALAERIIADTQEDNLKFLERLDEDGRTRMREDARWWSAAAYEQRWSADAPLSA